MENSNDTKTLGRRKIPMRKIENKLSLQVAFTKRRGGLFRKATELSILCGAEVAILVQSPAQKLYAFGHPALIDRIDPISLRRCDDDGYKTAMKMEKRRRGDETMSPSRSFESPFLCIFRNGTDVSNGRPVYTVVSSTSPPRSSPIGYCNRLHRTSSSR
ncbi:hypothetical protein SASPL_108257 [Salvia splendens]|uniref:MADS-box domain-containing protein n=1 Tax=Salvia splendens TaxID=180675 RepID=A0A8X8YDZ5_SALSN|nr:hypothetical protein SASPL_108257 [Salvia splendens]